MLGELVGAGGAGRPRAAQQIRPKKRGRKNVVSCPLNPGKRAIGCVFPFNHEFPSLRKLHDRQE